jgi:hypothetical protein
LSTHVGLTAAVLGDWLYLFGGASNPTLGFVIEGAQLQ